MENERQQKKLADAVLSSAFGLDGYVDYHIPGIRNEQRIATAGAYAIQ